MAKTAIIFGVTGQDGAYLAQFLLDKGYRVIGTTRYIRGNTTWRLQELGIKPDTQLVEADLARPETIHNLIESAAPDEIYNLAAQSSVQASFEDPLFTTDVNATGVVRILEIVRRINPKIRFWQASSSEMFGLIGQEWQDETSPFRPRSPYAVSKVFAHSMSAFYRNSYGLYTSCGILFNHESPLRGEQFVARKITLSLAKIKHGQLEFLELGNLGATRDWGFAGDFVEAMWKMLQQNKSDDYVIGTGESHSVRELLSHAALVLGMDLVFDGNDEKEKAIDRLTGRVVARVSPRFFRPLDSQNVRANFTKAATLLDWRPKTMFHELIALMTEADDRRVCNSLS